jgi:hypothetical protein
MDRAKFIPIVTLSKAGKMPSPSYSTPAQACRTGGALSKIPGSVCHGCYARKGNYTFPNVRRVRDANLADVLAAQDSGDWSAWIDAMVAAIGASAAAKVGYFRWHDSGDVQSLGHLEAIAEVARRLPAVRFWLPTKEKGDVLAYVRAHGDFPVNLTVRLSGAMIDGPAPKAWGITSTVYKAGAPIGFACGAYTRDGKCGDCRACWSRDVANVSYPKH